MMSQLLLMRKHCLLASAASLQLTAILQLAAKLFPSGINRVTICIYISSWSVSGRFLLYITQVLMPGNVFKHSAVIASMTVCP